MRLASLSLISLATLAASSANLAHAAETTFRVHEVEKQLGVGYAVRLLDMNRDKKPDIVVVDTDRVIWYENPSWQRHTLLQGQTKKDNVCIAPYDIDGDGKIDFALGADWRPFDTVSGGTIQWLSRGKSESDNWQVHPIGTEPTVHRMQWVDLDGNGKSKLIVVPLMGRGTTRPAFSERPIRILAYAIPKDPIAGPWVAEVLNEELHVAHNFTAADVDKDGRTDLLVASFEGVTMLSRSDNNSKWIRTHLGEGNQNNQRTPPNRGASEIKYGRLAGGLDYIATIEPWHGYEVVVYTRPETKATANGKPPLWVRHMLDDQLQWGHAVWCANLDDDLDEELIIGVRDDQPNGQPCGLRIYDPQVTALGITWQRQMVDEGGVAIEDAAAADLDGDGDTDIVAVGRKTKNVRIYWNE